MSEYYNNLDKRTKEYKEWAASLKQPEGLGDKVEKFTEATGIKKLVKTIAGDDCGCNERKEKLNKLFRTQIECPDQNDFEYLKHVFDTKPKLTGEVQIKMQAIYEKVFKRKLVTSCLSCSFIKTIYNPLERVYNNNL